MRLRRFERRISLSSPSVWFPLVATAATFALTAHVWASPGHREIAGNPHDTDLFCWYLQHAAHSITQLSNPFTISQQNAPVGVNPMWNTPLVLPALLVAPITLWWGSLVAYNLLLTMGFALAAISAFALLRRHVERTPAAAIGALLYGFSPAMLASGRGHVDLVMTALAPLAVLILDHLVRGRASPIRCGVALGVLAAVQLLVDEEVLFEIAVACALALVVAGACQPQRIAAALPRLGIALGIGAVVTVILAGYPLWLQFFGRLQEHGSPFTTAYFVSDLKGFITPSGQYVVATAADTRFAAAYVGGLPEYMNYLGIPVIACSVAVAASRFRDVRVRVASITAVLLALASMGPRLLHGGHYTQHWLPWSLVSHVPLAESALPNRFAILVTLAAGFLVAIALDRLWAGQRATQALAVIAAVAIVVTLLPRPFPTTAVPPSPPFFTTAAGRVVVPAGSTALVLPFPTATETRPLAWQAAADLRFAMPGGYFIGPAPGGRAFIGGPGPRASASVLIRIGRTGVVPAVTAAARRQLAADVAYWRADTVLLGPTRHRAALARYLTRVLRASPVVIGGVATWRIPPGMR